MELEARLTALGFSAADAETLADHFEDAERRGKRGHGFARVDWLETLEGLDPNAEPECVVAEACYERWEGRGALGYLTLAERTPPLPALVTGLGDHTLGLRIRIEPFERLQPVHAREPVPALAAPLR